MLDPTQDIGKINFSDSCFDLYDMNYENIDLQLFKKWIDTQISEGKTKIKLNIDWGYYNDISGLDLETV